VFGTCIRYVITVLLVHVTVLSVHPGLGQVLELSETKNQIVQWSGIFRASGKSWI